MRVLGIESSCDETSVAVFSDGVLKSNLIASQDVHTLFGGVVPELSSRAHLQMVTPLVKKALQESNLGVNDLDVIAATAGPGLIGALLVGLTFAKGLSFSTGKPFVPVNHIEGHIYSGFLMPEKPVFPYLCLVVSGGHTLLLIVKSDSEIIRLGTTIDDAAGEAFDKVSKLLGLGYPGGPKIQEAALEQPTDLASFPIAQCRNEFDFSFSGLKTAVLRFVQKEYGSADKIPPEDLRLIAASFQKALVEALSGKVLKAVKTFNVKSISVVGGVAANRSLIESISGIAGRYGKKLIVPSLQFCGDNAAMIAYRGQKLFESGRKFDFDFKAYPSLPDSIFSEIQESGL